MNDLKFKENKDDSKTFFACDYSLVAYEGYRSNVFDGVNVKVYYFKEGIRVICHNPRFRSLDSVTFIECDFFTVQLANSYAVQNMGER